MRIPGYSINGHLKIKPQIKLTLFCYTSAELQIRGVIEAVLMRSHKICSTVEMWLIIPQLSLLPLLIWSTASGPSCCTKGP